MCLASTVAPGTTAAALSVTMPVSVAKVVWAELREAITAMRSPPKRTQRKILIKTSRIGRHPSKRPYGSQTGVRRLLQHPRHVSLRYEPDGNARDFFQRLDIDDRHVVGHRVGHVGRLPVRRERDPARSLSTELGASQRFQVRKRV